MNQIAELQDLARHMLAMLRDLEEGYSWRELHIDLASIEDQARSLGVRLERDE